jgi:CRISPR/Cas system endoribonuclease Cas6 (RAMP superfamily)
MKRGGCLDEIRGLPSYGILGAMKASENRLSEERRERTEAIVEEHVDALFRRVPMLSGFSLRHDLELADVSVQTWPGYGAGAELYQELVQTLAELAEERPDAVELLRGRTFARALH